MADICWKYFAVILCRPIRRGRGRPTHLSTLRCLCHNPAMGLRSTSLENYTNLSFGEQHDAADHDIRVLSILSAFTLRSQGSMCFQDFANYSHRCITVDHVNRESTKLTHCTSGHNLPIFELLWLLYSADNSLQVVTRNGNGEANLTSMKNLCAQAHTTVQWHCSVNYDAAVPVLN